MLPGSLESGQIVARRARVLVKRGVRTGNGLLLLHYAAGRYWSEVAQHHRDSDATFRDLERLVSHLCANKRLDKITDADVSAMFAWWRSQTLKGWTKSGDGKEVLLAVLAAVGGAPRDIRVRALLLIGFAGGFRWTE